MSLFSGDLCDDDLDGDGVINDLDNCPYLSNAGQTDVDGNGVGDDCETDSDGDGVADKNDTCPDNPAISVTSFSEYFTVDLDPSVSGDLPDWRVKDNGAEVQQTAYTWMPTMLIGMQELILNSKLTSTYKHRVINNSDRGERARLKTYSCLLEGQ